MRITKREQHTAGMFFKRTIAAQLHALGCVLWIVGAFFLLPKAHQNGGASLVASIAFMSTGFLVFLTSATYHFLGDGFEASEKLHLFFENLDHFSIYLFIAGTYTPFFLFTLSSPWDAILITSIWTIAALGIMYTWFKPRLPPFLQRRFFYTGIFVAMGWTMVFRIQEILAHLSHHQFVLLLTGGLAYTIGAVFYTLKKPNLIKHFLGYHELWHLCVLTGACFHYWLIVTFY